MSDLVLSTRESYSSSLYVIEEFSVIGTCETQEDATGCCIEGNTAVMVLCDGIGGLERGDIAAKTAVDTILKSATRYEWKERPHEFLSFLIQEANRAVYEAKDENGEELQCGCTLVLVLTVGRKLYWGNVGDSRAYLIRKDAFTLLTEDHNYAEQLKAQLENDEITEEEYIKCSEKGAALTSYLGMGKLKKCNVCEHPIMLERDEIVLIESDGLYKLLDECEIRDVVRGGVRRLDQVGMALLKHAEERVTGYQDNTSIILFRIK